MLTLRDTTDTTGALDGSAADLQRLLQELVELAGQEDDAEAAPVLELQFGDVLTKTTMSVSHGVECLSVTALLPMTEYLNGDCRQPRVLAASGATEGEIKLLWHADEERYVVVCTTPISELSREVSVLDTIMDTSEQARAWLSVVDICAPVPR
jgi:hypothetical protein